MQQQDDNAGFNFVVELLFVVMRGHHWFYCQRGLNDLVDNVKLIVECPLEHAGDKYISRNVRF